MLGCECVSILPIVTRHCTCQLRFISAVFRFFSFSIFYFIFPRFLKAGDTYWCNVQGSFFFLTDIIFFVNLLQETAWGPHNFNLSTGQCFGLEYMNGYRK